MQTLPSGPSASSDPNAQKDKLLFECMISEQIPPEDMAEILRDDRFRAYYERNLVEKAGMERRDGHVSRLFAGLGAMVHSLYGGRRLGK